MNTLSRRDFLKHSAALTAGVGLLGSTALVSPAAPPFHISLAQWSLHKTLFGGHLNNLDFARTAKRDFGIEAIEYVNQFFMDKAKDRTYLQEMKTRAEGEGVRSLLIMCDSEGYLGDVDTAKRTQAVENHYKWVEAAQYLGCHSIRVNAFSEGTFLEQQERAADGLRRLCEFANPYGINVIVENHGGLSSNGAWLVGVMRLVNHPRVGILPDFGNFCIRREGGHPWEGACVEEYDRYQGVQEMMPYARAVSAKSNNFDAAGNCVETDYPRIMKVVLEAGYRGFVGIEYEGDELDEPGGIRATRDLLLRIREQMS
jgi:sugar phosphate isomerase/epimerase